MAYLWKRGRVYWFRMRCPERYRFVYEHEFITKSLKTDSRFEAESLVPLVKSQILSELDARLAGKIPEQTREAYQATLALAKIHNIKLKTMEDIISGPVSNIIERIERLQSMDPNNASQLFAVQMGNIKLPTTTMTAWALNMADLRPNDILYKNDRQVRMWKAKYIRAAKCFFEAVTCQGYHT